MAAPQPAGLPLLPAAAGACIDQLARGWRACNLGSGCLPDRVPSSPLPACLPACPCLCLQGDVRFAEVMGLMGAKVEWAPYSITITGGQGRGRGRCTVERGGRVYSRAGQEQRASCTVQAVVQCSVAIPCRGAAAGCCLHIAGCRGLAWHSS